MISLKLSVQTLFWTTSSFSLQEYPVPWAVNKTDSLLNFILDYLPSLSHNILSGWKEPSEGLPPIEWLHHPISPVTCKLLLLYLWIVRKKNKAKECIWSAPPPPLPPFQNLFFNFSITIHVQYNANSRCATQWLDIYVTYEVITPINLVPIGHHT